MIRRLLVRLPVLRNIFGLREDIMPEQKEKLWPSSSPTDKSANHAGLSGSDTDARLKSIDVNDLIAAFDLDHYKKMANEYFSKISLDHDVMRKPFNTQAEAALLLPGVAAVIDGLGLFKGARILDFGCGGGWLTRVFALLGSEAYGIDLAASAVDVASKALAADLFAGKIQAEFREYDGRTVPFSADFFDGIAVFDAFHHIANQAEVLADLHRVLKPGGRIVFHEPGPNHSKLPQSQMEMRNYGVIERDLVMEEIVLMAAAAGFEPPEMAFFMPSALWTDLSEFNDLIRKPSNRPGPAEVHLGQRLRLHAHSGFQNMRVFALKKPGEIKRDSRQPLGLSARIEVLRAVRSAGNITCSASVTNTGTSIWLPSGVKVGGVNLGLQLLCGDSVTDRDFRRVSVSEAPIHPGESVAATFTACVPDGADLRLDMVAEGIIWFEQMGGQGAVVNV